jgi:hypothetical protein
MKHTIEMGSGAVIYLPSYIKIVSAIEKFIGGDTHRDTDSKVIS